MMPVLTCPHCKKPLPRGLLRPAHVRDAAAKAVLHAARRPASMAVLARAYAKVAGVAMPSARRAVERLAARGTLRRVGPAVYIVST